jgi:hypothetical protein
MDLTDLVSSGRNKNEEENSFIHEYELKGLAFRAERFVILYPKYSKLFNNQLSLHPLSFGDKSVPELFFGCEFFTLQHVGLYALLRFIHQLSIYTKTQSGYRRALCKSLA